MLQGSDKSFSAFPRRQEYLPHPCCYVQIIVRPCAFVKCLRRDVHITAFYFMKIMPRDERQRTDFSRPLRPIRTTVIDLPVPLRKKEYLGASRSSGVSPARRSGAHEYARARHSRNRQIRKHPHCPSRRPKFPPTPNAKHPSQTDVQ